MRLILHLRKLQVFALFLFLKLHLTTFQVVPILPPSLKQQVQQLRHYRRKKKLILGRSLEASLVV